VLEGIPTVAIGLFAFWFLRPLAEELFPFLPWSGPFSIGIAGMAVGLMIVPLVASISEDAMRAVPQSLREGGYALGTGKLKVSTRIVFPAAISGSSPRSSWPPRGRSARRWSCSSPPAPATRTCRSIPSPACRR
jgi:ABC-type phosphate transport system permease subunit